MAIRETRIREIARVGDAAASRRAAHFARIVFHRISLNSLNPRFIYHAAPALRVPSSFRSARRIGTVNHGPVSEVSRAARLVKKSSPN